MDEEKVCKHLNAVTYREYETGLLPNLLGRLVNAIMRKIYCPDCKTDKVFIKGL